MPTHKIAPLRLVTSLLDQATRPQHNARSGNMTLCRGITRDPQQLLATFIHPRPSAEALLRTHSGCYGHFTIYNLLTLVLLMGGEVPPRPIFCLVLPNRLEVSGTLWWLFIELTWLQNAATNFFLSLSGTSWQQLEPGKSVGNLLVF